MSTLRRHLPSRTIALTAAGTVAVVVVAKIVLLVLADRHIYNFSTPLPVAVLGAITGMTYGLLAAGLVLIFRTNKIINFAHGQIGAFGAAFFGIEVEVFMVKISYQQKPYRRSMMQAYGATVHASPTNLTDAGRSIH